MEIAPGLHLVEGTRGANVYLIVEDALTLVDTGLPGNGLAIANYVVRLGRRPDELRRVVLTHNHLDHSGSAAQVRTLTGARVLAHAAEADGGMLVPGVSGAGGSVLRNVCMLLHVVQPVPVDDLLQDGSVIPALGGLRVLHMPGHTPGSICLYSERRGVLFTGDVMINNGNRLSQAFPLSQHDRKLAQQALTRLLPLSIQLCCFAHGRPLGDGVGARVIQFAQNPATSHPWWRLVKNMRLLIFFGLRLLRGKG